MVAIGEVFNPEAAGRGPACKGSGDTLVEGWLTWSWMPRSRGDPLAKVVSCGS